MRWPMLSHCKRCFREGPAVALQGGGPGKARPREFVC